MKAAKKTEALPKYRLYCLTNMYLSSIQKGIQTAHVVGELAKKFGPLNTFQDWAEFDKTIIVLNGGNSHSLALFGDILWNQDEFLCAEFCEDLQSLNGALTAVGVVLPEEVYSGKSRNKNAKKIYNWIKDLPLAT
jgi:hypothetical protein